MFPRKSLLPEHAKCKRQASVRNCTKSARRRFQTQDVSYLERHINHSTTWDLLLFVLFRKRKPLGNARHNIACQLQRQCLWLVWTMELWHCVGWWTFNNANTNGKTLNFFLQGVFTSLDLPFLFSWQNNHRPHCRPWFWVCVCHDNFNYEEDMRCV